MYPPVEKRMFIYDTYQREVNSFVAALKKSEELDDAVCARILSLMDATTLAFYSRGSWKYMGMIEDVSEFDKIAGYMLDFNVDKGFKQTNYAISNHPELEHLTVAAGCTVAWSFDRQSSEEDFILLFLKPEVIQEVTWGSKTSCMGGSLNPINSFGQWKEAMKGRSEEWSPQSRHLVHAIVSKFSEIKFA